MNYYARMIYNIKPSAQRYKNTTVILTLLSLGLKYRSIILQFKGKIIVY